MRPKPLVEVFPAFTPTKVLPVPVVCTNSAPLREMLPVASSTRRRSTVPVLFLIEKPLPASSCTETSPATAGGARARATPSARVESQINFKGWTLPSGVSFAFPAGAEAVAATRPRRGPSYTADCIEQRHSALVRKSPKCQDWTSANGWAYRSSRGGTLIVWSPRFSDVLGTAALLACLLVAVVPVRAAQNRVFFSPDITARLGG